MLLDDGTARNGSRAARHRARVPELAWHPTVPTTDSLEAAAFDAWPSPAAIIGRDGTLLVVNGAWRRNAAADGGGAGTQVGASYLAVCDAAIGSADQADGRSAGAGLRALLAGDRSRFDHSYRCDVPGGGPRWAELTAVRIADPPGAMVVHTEVTDRERLHHQLQARALLLDEVGAAVILTDLAGAVTLWSRGAQELYGWSAAEVLGRPITELTGTGSSSERPTEIVRRVTATGSWEGEVTLRRRDGTTFPAHVRDTAIHDAAGEPIGVAGVSFDLSARRAMEDQLGRSHRELQALTDNLGDGVCRIDVHGTFSYANAQALRLLRAPADDVLGSPALRWLAPSSRQHAVDLAAAADHGTPTPIEVTLRRGDGTTLPIEYLATPLAPDEHGPSDWVVVLRDISERRTREDALATEVEQLRWLQRIRDALDGAGFVLHTQPIVDLATGDVVHHEVLVRMRDADHPTRLYPPGRFIPIAEAAGLAPAIDRWVIREAISLASQGHDLHVNLSARSLGDDGLPRYIATLLDDAAVAPEQLVFEITETALVDNLDAVCHLAERLRDLGCGLALDDFGTGYGGFTYLKRLPIDALKIDIEFVRDAVTNPASRHVIDAVVSLARAFGLVTVGEGVEDQATLDTLKELNVDLAQGYFLGRPAALDAHRQRLAGTTR